METRKRKRAPDEDAECSSVHARFDGPPPLALLSPNTPKKQSTSTLSDILVPATPPSRSHSTHSPTSSQSSGILSPPPVKPTGLPITSVGLRQPKDLPLPPDPSQPIIETHSFSTPSDPPLSPQQSQILQRILDGENILFTGSAGTGKSVLLRAIIKAFSEKYAEEMEDDEAYRKKCGEENGGKVYNIDEQKERRWKLAVTASTGMAAINIGGKTIHSWSGVGTGEKPVTELIAMALRSLASRRSWRSTRILMIDEVSMIDGKLFDKIEAIARTVRANSKPFGGMQVILSGDFHQLPPVSREGELPFKFAFEAKCWSSVIPNKSVVTLQRVFRQSDETFIRILENMRKGIVSKADEAMLKSLKRTLKFNDGIEAVELYPTQNQVQTLNYRKLNTLPGDKIIYDAIDTPGEDNSGRPLSSAEATVLLDRNTAWPGRTELKVGAMVMLVTNLQKFYLVNGSIGKIVAFQTIDEAVANGAQLPADSNFFSPPRDQAFPVVEFVPARFAPGLQAKRTIIPIMEVTLDNIRGEPHASRRIVPLILAWSITIHKAQGQSLERVKVDLNKVFADGQSYVAISRAVCMEGLEIQNFNAKKVRVNPRVIEWSAKVAPLP